MLLALLVFQLITLPVEFNASSRALKELKKLKTENPDDADYSKAKTNLIVSKLSMEYIYQNMTQDEIEQTRFEYLMKRCKTGSVTLVEGITVEEASVIGENTNILKGIQII